MHQWTCRRMVLSPRSQMPAFSLWTTSTISVATCNACSFVMPITEQRFRIVKRVTSEERTSPASGFLLFRNAFCDPHVAPNENLKPSRNRTSGLRYNRPGSPLRLSKSITDLTR